MQSVTLIMILIVTMLALSGYLLLRPKRFRLAALRDERSFMKTAAILAGMAKNFSLERIFRRSRREKMDRAIFDAVSFIRNLVAAHRGNYVSADMLLEQLAQTDSIIAPNFKLALTRLRMGKKDEMASAFAREIGTDSAGDLIRIILRWDQVDPAKLASTLQSYQSAIKEARTTRIKRSNETYSDLLYLPVILNVLLVLVNFLFVGYFIEQRELINQLFFS